MIRFDDYRGRARQLRAQAQELMDQAREYDERADLWDAGGLPEVLDEDDPFGVDPDRLLREEDQLAGGDATINRPSDGYVDDEGDLTFIDDVVVGVNDPDFDPEPWRPEDTEDVGFGRCPDCGVAFQSENSRPCLGTMS